MEDQPHPNLLILGASTRAAAFSALRGGWRPICLDQFADTDLRARAVAQRIENYPEGLIEAMQAIPTCPVLYVGGIENHPDVIRTAEKLHRLWGNDAQAVSRARDPEAIAECVRLARAGNLEWRPQEEAPPPDGNWVVRPLRGSGGRGIHLWTEEAATVSTLAEPHAFQQRIEGIPYSAVFIAAQTVGDVRFVGITRQLIGQGDGRSFEWKGNVGPVTLSVAVEHVIRRVGNILKWKLGLKGIFGVDFVVDAQEVCWVTEVNPRYPASAELLEFATGYSLVSAHCRCFAPEEVPSPAETIVTPEAPFLGKAVLYASRGLTVSSPLADPSKGGLEEFPENADLPAVGQRFHAGDPVCTVFATDGMLEGCCEKLEQRLQETEALLTAD